MPRLPDLAFGNSSAGLVGGGANFVEAIARFVPSLSHISADRSAELRTRFDLRRIGETSLMAFALSASEMEIEDSQGWHLVVPFCGHSRIKVGQDTIALAGGQNGLLMPNVRRFATNSARSGVIVNLDMVRLRDILAIVSGLDAQSIAIESRVHDINLRQQRALFPSFQHICRLIDATSADPRQAALLGIDDLLYRWTALSLGLLSPADKSGPGHDEQHRLDVVCDLVRSAHERPFTLTEMEAMSGLSARALQYAFKSRFGCSPMEWQRRERIGLARNRLMFASPDETITQIAHDMGFASSAAFAAQYRRYFGATPSQAIRSHG